ncbi:MAG TPA: vitamin K epoxide reductase family protein [Cyclobacteriaceae bacterium]|jgi:uncharacterized membrane protein|nr:vitamin K epoxide reductase family protein [Cyclobacteriaceae bacterium]
MSSQIKHNPEDNAAQVTTKLLKLLHVPFTSKFSRDLKLRPEFPSLLSISNALNELNVKNVAVSISVGQLTEMFFPAIAQVQSNGGGFVIILNIENGIVNYLNGHLKKTQAAINDFVMDWTGVLLLAETNEKSGEPNYAENRRTDALSKIRYAALTILSVGIFSTLVYFKPDFILPVILQALGLGLCITLLIETLGQSTLLSDAACRPNSKIDCKQVVNSSAAKIYGDISLAEIGVLFFAGSLLANLIMASNGQTPLNSYLFFFFAASFPFSIFSIYYQWQIIKSWCSICLGVMGLLWATSAYYWLNYSSVNFNFNELIPVLSGYSFPLIVWFMIRPYILQAQSAPALRKSLYGFIKNQYIFDTLSLGRKQLVEGNFGEGLVLGNANAKHTITLVTSPACGPCVNAHHNIESWMNQYQELKVIVRFAVNPKENGSIPNTVARNIISLGLKKDHVKMKEAMRTWYNKKRPDLKEWLSALPADLHQGTEERFTNDYNFFSQNNITAVPAIFFNDKQIPAEFSLKDFENILRQKLNASDE